LWGGGRLKAERNVPPKAENGTKQSPFLNKKILRGILYPFVTFVIE